MGRIQQCVRGVLYIANKTEDFGQARKRIEQLFDVSKAQHRGHLAGSATSSRSDQPGI
jgi:hypothetical protein